MFELENERLEITDIRKLLPNVKNSCFSRLFFPSRYASELAIEKELLLIDQEIEFEIEQPVFSSGHAFVCFDSLSSAFFVLNSFEEKTWSNIKVSLNQLMLSKQTARRKRTSTFGKFDNLEGEEEIMDVENLALIADPMIEPVDIIWNNVGDTGNFYFWRRIFLNIFGVLLLCFITTPAFFVSSVREFAFWKRIKELAAEFGVVELVQIYAYPVFVLLLNQVLLILIDYAARLERYYTHSRYHSAVMFKSFIYLLLNMLIIPGITMTTSESLFQLLYEENLNLPEIIGKIYLYDSGSFFFNLVIQSAIFSSTFYLLRMDELSFNSFSTFVTHYKRLFVNRGKHFQRKDVDCYYLGYFYAHMLVIYSIVLVFSTTVPFISVAGLLYFYLKYIVDFVSFATVHRKEVDSDGYLVFV